MADDVPMPPAGEGWETSIAAIGVAGLILIGGSAGFGLPLWLTGPLAGVVLVSVILMAMLRQRVIDQFYQPRLPRTSLDDEDWKRVETSVQGGLKLPTWYRRQVGAAPLVLVMHGWESTPARMKPRLDHLHDLGCHVITFEFRGHGSAPKDNRWTGVKALGDARAVLNEATKHIPKQRITKVLLYGHSLGGFVTLRLSSNARHWWGRKLAGVILESPMTDLMLAIDQNLSGPAGMLKGPARGWILQEFRRVHPDLADLTEDDFRVPKWGLPQVPTLTIQAEKDETLGRGHYDALVAAHTKAHDHHLVSDLGHGADVANNALEGLVADFVKPFVGGAASDDDGDDEDLEAPKRARSGGKKSTKPTGQQRKQKKGRR